MTTARNSVIAGDYNGVRVSINHRGAIVLSPSISETVYLNKDFVESYEIMTEERIKDSTSAVIKAGVASWLIGPTGILAGISAREHGVYLVAIKFWHGEKSLIEIDERLYKTLITTLF